MKLPNEVVRQVVQDFDNAELGDPRRTRRVQRVVAKLAQAPQSAIPAAMGSEAELEGAYRLMSNPAVTFESLGKAHVEATRKRAEAAGEVLVLHDTTTCGWKHVSPEEIGYLPTGKAGFNFHPSVVVELEHALPLGISHGEVIVRHQRSRRSKGKRHLPGSATAKQKDREYTRWWRGIEASASLLKNCKKVIHVTDREGDSYALLAQMVMAALFFVVRVRCDRKAREPGSEDETWSTLKKVLSSAEGVIEREVPISTRKPRTAPRANEAHPPRKARIAKLHFSAAAVEIARPSYLDDSVPVTLRLNAVHVVERNPPPGQDPVEWLLFTTEPIDTPKQIVAIVDWYRMRWIIEEFNKALKTGCAYEKRKFESLPALLNILALCLPIAIQLLALRTRARTDPNARATEIMTPLQIRILRLLGFRKLSSHPSAQEALLAVAALGGHKRSNGDPGWLVLYRGMQKLLDAEIVWKIARNA